jgi:hypothetical protein
MCAFSTEIADSSDAVWVVAYHNAAWRDRRAALAMRLEETQTVMP